MRKIMAFILTIVLCSGFVASSAKEGITVTDKYYDTWTATDHMGRSLATFEEAGLVKEGRHDVAMFYHNWHRHGEKALIASEVIKKYPDAKDDFYHKGWEGTYDTFWGESIYGFYSTDDYWHNRKAAELMASAGVDVIFLDYTNLGNVYEVQLKAMIKAYKDAIADGCDVPKINFFFPMGGDKAKMFEMLKSVYEIFYADESNSALFYYYEDKPLVVMGYGAGCLDAASDKDKALADKMREFFTFRHTSGRGNATSSGWNWLVHYPQGLWGKTSDGRVESVNLGMAINQSYAIKGNIDYPFSAPFTKGKSYTEGFGEDKRPEALHEGYFFREQASRVLEVDPEVVFVTGWNEWLVSRMAEHSASGTKNAMYDLFDDEHSRDFEPSKGVLKDGYYMLLCDFVRKYKGVRPTPLASGDITIDIMGDASQWDGVIPEFINENNGYERDAISTYLDSNGETYHYKTEVVNAISRAKVAKDSENFWFYAECIDEIKTGNKGFMTLWINSDRNIATGWEGYDYAVNLDGFGKISALNPNFTRRIVGDVEITVSGTALTLKLPKSMIGYEGKADIEFKWTDNINPDGDIMLFYTEGSSAPVGRFNYHYTEIAETTLTKEEREALSDTTVVKANSGKIIIKGAKMLVYEKDIRVKTFPENGTVYVPMGAIEEAMGYGRSKVFYNSDLNAVYFYTYDLINDNITNYEWAYAYLDSGEAFYNGYQSMTLANSIKASGGVIYIPLTFLSDCFGWDIKDIGENAFAISKNEANVDAAKAVLSHLE
ncbi:MAG: hypothetical protein IJD97_11865 [Clostridia bacterium]|nr:hypothetical protein [Clostridia bacterium]